MAALNAAQIEILKMFEQNVSEEELTELKKLLHDFFAKKLVASADATFEKKNYTMNDIEAWKQERNRTPY